MTPSVTESELSQTATMTPASTSMRVSAEPSAAPLARSFIRDYAVLDSMRYTEADLLITEMVCNVVQHARSATEVELTVDTSNPGTVRISLTHDFPKPLNDPRRGVGFLLLERLSHSWGHDHDGNRLEIWFTLRKPGSIAGHDQLEDGELSGGMSLDPAACTDALIRRHRDLAVAISRRYRGKGVPDDDLEQVALMGLLKAIQRFDPTKGELRPYAAATISGELKKWLRDKGWSVRVPRSIQELALETGRASEKLTQKLSREPTLDEIAEHLGLAEDELVDATSARQAYSSRSIDKTQTGSDRTLLDTLEDEDCLMRDAEDRLMLHDAISRLRPRQQLIMTLRFHDDMSQAQIARIVGISQAHVSRQISHALSEMAEILVAQTPHESQGRTRGSEVGLPSDEA